jgi:N-acetylmuramoyl-L-alanine amidase
MRLGTLRWIQRLFLFIILAAAATGGWFAYQSVQAGAGPAFLQTLMGVQPLGGMRVGIVAGHSGNDSGAVCPDGLTEAEVNMAAAQAVVRSLEGRGIAADLLEEFDDRLDGYRADAFVSIHADSCGVDFSGFKVASLEGGSNASEQLAQCLWDRYEAATGLARHPSTITYDMTKYHAFREIASSTPAAIIEIGFLRGDRELLTQQTERVAQGIVDGIECFINPEEEPAE